MAGMVSVSRTDLQVRRHKLRRQRQMKIIQAIWQTSAVSSLLGGLLWVASQPMWVLSAPKQIEIVNGSSSLSPEAISSLLVLSYPQSLWRIEPSLIADSLTKQPTIAKASVKRRLFPPGLIIDILSLIDLRNLPGSAQIIYTEGSIACAKPTTSLKLRA